MNIDTFEFKAKDGTYKIDSDDKINEDEEAIDDYNKSANPMNHRK